jgi:hypothetical protein
MAAFALWVAAVAIAFILVIVVTVYVIDNIFALTIAAVLVFLVNSVFHIIH